MAFFIHVLPDVTGDLGGNPGFGLLPVSPSFFLPELEDKPQDPIIAAFSRFEPILESQDVTPSQNSLPSKRAELASKGWSPQYSCPDIKESDKGLSWDKLGTVAPPHSDLPRGPFLSEQPSSVFFAAQYQSQPAMQRNDVHRVHVTRNEFYHAISTNVYGNSSSIYVWDKETDSFTLRGCPKGHQEVLTVDYVPLSSLVPRFLKVGMLLRRLETLILLLRAGSHGTATASFTHGLADIIEHMHSTSIPMPSSAQDHLVSLWSHYATPEVILEALADLCYRDSSLSPPYPPLWNNTASLASRIYHKLAEHIASHSCLAIRANLAYLLSVTSKEIFRTLGSSIGLVAQTPASKFPKNFIAQDADPPDDDSDSNTAGDDAFPDFIPKAVSSQVGRARRSLALLTIANPDHPLCRTEAHWQSLCQGWTWADASVNTLTDRLEDHTRKVNSKIDEWRSHHSSRWANQSDMLESPAPQSVALHYGLGVLGVQNQTLPQTSQYGPDLAQFQLFDLEPGSHLSPMSPLAKWQKDEANYELSYSEFVRTFPNTLPPVAPTLQTLVDVIGLQPLVAHSRILSFSLLDLFLSDLDFIAHIELLHRFMLFGDPSFSNRLRTALFVENDLEELPRNSHSQAQRKGRSQVNDANTAWGVGLNPALSERGSWPPGGSELAFSLRRVVVDTLDEDRVETDEGERKTGGGLQRDQIWNEAEWRLGFIIRHLEEDEDERGNPNWLDPTSIEAFDFLDMDYKTPPTISVLITLDVLDKYRRIFNFLLRLLRVDSVARMIFRSERDPRSTPFSSRPSARQRMHHFAFQSNAFVQALSTYVVDSAIGVNHRAFVNRLIKIRHGVSEHYRPHGEDEDTPEELHDVFSILKYHSTVMDRILEACFLKARHRAVGGASMVDCMEMILDVGQLLVDTKTGKISEEASERRLGRMHERFHQSLQNMITGLKLLDESGQAKRDRFVDQAMVEGDSSPNSDLDLLTSGDVTRNHVSGLSNLLVRLDASNWYRNKGT